ncbi:hypothetical protein AURDEDRAFT_120843 [Auricularia subglabra TFB-10046 SS5]|nr:hypothetical protein AURDEDRAFT_120843 [Auricularia subglabra TFB-10046 SS5]
MEPTPTQDGSASDLDPTTNAFAAKQPSVVGDSSPELPANTAGESKAAQPGKMVQCGASKSEGASTGNTTLAKVVSGDGQLTSSYNDVMSDDEWETLYMSGTQDAGLDRLIGFSKNASNIKACKTGAEGASSPTITAKSDSASAPPTCNACAETAPDGPSADLSPANSGSTRTPDTTPELTSTEPSPARSTSSALSTPPADVAPAQPSYDGGQRKVSELGFPNALLEEFTAGLSPEAQQLATAIAAQVGLPGDTQLAALLRPHPSETVIIHSRRNHGNDVVQPDKHVENAPVASGRSAALRDAARVKFRAGSLSLAASITAQVGVDGPTNLDPLLLASPAPALRVLKRGRDEDNKVEAVHKRTKESRGTEQNQAASVQGIENMQIPSAGDVQADLYEGHTTFDSDTQLIVPAGQSTPRIDTHIPPTGAPDDDDGWAEWDDAISDVDVAHEDSLPHTVVQHASNVSIHPQQQGAAQSSVAAPTGLGQHAQANSKVKSPLGKAIEAFAANAERPLVEAEIATRMLVRPHAVHPPEPKKVAASVKEDLRILLGAYPGSTFASSICDVCFAEGFFGRNIRNGAPKNDDKKRKQVLLDSLKIKELPEIGKKMTAENPFAGMPGLTTKVFERLLEDATAEARSSEASAES